MKLPDLKKILAGFSAKNIKQEITKVKLSDIKKVRDYSYLQWIRVVWLLFIMTWVCIFFWSTAVRHDLLSFFGGMPDLKDLENPKSELASELYSADGILLGKYFRENRTPISYDELSENLINALLATEDVRFEHHSGIDMKATLAVPYYLLKNDKRGSSTITQQLAKNLFKTRSYGGLLKDIPLLNKLIAKTKEWLLAIELERSYTKKEIMTLYLNTVEFGGNAFGIKAAAKTYYNTTPQKLTIDQAAMLVGMLKAPSLYSPIYRPENALPRRNTVIDQMQKYNYISQVEAEELKAMPLNTDEYIVDGHLVGVATYFRTQVAKWVNNFCRTKGLDLYADGLKIHTTIDSRLQKMAEESVEAYMPTVQKKFFEEWKTKKPWVDEHGKELPNFLHEAMKKSERYRLLKIQYKADTNAILQVMKTPVKMKVFTWTSPSREKDTLLSPLDSIAYYKYFMRTGMMSLDPNTGAIKAWVGGMNYKYFKYDHVQQGKRQVGSTFKPFVYAAAIKDYGYSPCDPVSDVPQTFALSDGTTWTAKNSTNEYTGKTYTLRQALSLSINTVSALLMRKVKPATVIKYARNMGIESEMQEVYSLCLGSNEASLFELTGAYATFVNKGVWIEPNFITHIEDKHGKIVYRANPITKTALDEQTAYLMLYMLKGVVEGGTAGGLWRYKFKQGNDVAGKTGTTQNNSDAWFVGCTKDLVTGVWVGGEDRSIHFQGQGGTGGKLAMPQFAMFTEKVYGDSTLGYKKGLFPMPKNLNVQLDCSKYQHGILALDSTTYIMPTGNPLSDDFN
jgi:penicillin-binding protein 1A